MTESYYQKKIIKAIEKMGGHVVNGNYTKAGEADLQCGYPVTLYKKLATYTTTGCNLKYTEFKTLVHLCIEVKTEYDYYRVMRAVDADYNVINSKALKSHEPLQMAKIRNVRRLGGLALVAFNIKQVKEYINGKEIS